MLIPQMDSMDQLDADQRPVVAVTGRMAWMKGLCLAGTVDGVAAAAETLSAGAIYAADVPGTGLKVVRVPPMCTYMEIGAFGSGSSIGTAPVLEFWRTHGISASDNWSKLYNVLGSSTVTLDGTVTDATGVAGATRYSVEEVTYQKHLYDLRGARLVVGRLTTIGTSNNWSLWHRFF